MNDSDSDECETIIKSTNFFIRVFKNEKHNQSLLEWLLLVVFFCIYNSYKMEREI